MRALRSRLAADRGGTAILEFAFIAPLMLTLILGIVDFGRMFYVRQGLEYATEEAARYYMLNSSTATSNVTSYLRGKMPGGMGPSVNVSYADTTNCNSNAAVTCTTITATYGFNFIAGFLNIGALTLQATARAVRY
jgi:Flp pilus assembly protein TadG